MSELTLDVRMDGFDAPIGVLVRDVNAALAFAYTPAHLARSAAVPLSLSLPLRAEPYADVATRAFFDNLLQENAGALADVMAREGLARDDVAGLLLHLGKDCPGAVSVVASGAPPVKVPGDLSSDYAPIAHDDLVAIVAALQDRQRLPAGTADPSPLAGVQSKIAVTRLADGTLALPLPDRGAPTTHILKVPDRGHRRDAAHEAAAMQLSAATGLRTARAEVVKIGGIEALLVTRFDRAADAAGRIVRRHQEDFAQALGLSSALKYERRGTPGRRFDVAAIASILDRTSDPIAERDTFVRATLFDLLIGNVDAHAKNFALLHLGPGRIETSPRYDLLPTRLDPQFTDELAYRISTATTLESLTAADFDAFLATLGITSRAARRRLAARHAANLAQVLSDRFAELTRTGLGSFADLMAANMRRLLPVFGLEVPAAAIDRDAFVPRGGGWAMS